MFLDIFCTAYLDDVLIYSSTLEEHKAHVKVIVETLAKAGLYLNPNKCKFYQQKVSYLGFIVFNKRLAMDPEKVKAITEWGPCKNLHYARAFLGFANFYRRFIKNYLKLVSSIIRLTRKDVPFKWDENCQQVMAALKRAFVTAPVLAHFNPNREVLVEADASDYVSTGVVTITAPALVT